MGFHVPQRLHIVIEYHNCVPSHNLHSAVVPSKYEKERNEMKNVFFKSDVEKAVHNIS